MTNTHIKERDVFKLSRLMYIFEAMFEYFITLLTSGAYLAKLTTTIGISDGMTAVLSSITSLAGMFQIISIFLAHKTPVKRWVLPLTFLTQSLVSTLYVLPFLNLGGAAPVIFFAIMLISKAGSNITPPIKANWFLSLVDDKKRGDYQAKINIVSLAGGMIFTLVASSVIDTFEANQNLNGAFTVMTVTICILTLLQVSALIIAKEKPSVSEKTESPFKALKSLLKNNVYKRVIIANFLWAIATNITTPFLSTFQIKELGFSMTFISGIGIVLSILHIFVVYFFGRYSMHHSYTSIMRISYIFAAASFLFVSISTPANGYVVFTIYRLAFLLFESANTVSATSILFIIVPQSDRTSAIAINTIISGLAGFLMTLAVSPIVSFIQSTEIFVFGIQVYAQQILAVVSLVITLFIFLYYQLFCHKLLKKTD